MPEQPRRTTLDPILIEQLVASGEDAPSDDEKLDYMTALRSSSAAAGRQLDLQLVAELTAQHKALVEARRAQTKVKRLVEKLTQPPLHPAIFLGHAPSDKGPSVVVHHGSARRVVSALDDVEVEDLQVGDEVWLGPELNLLVRRSACPLPRTGETAVFDRYTPDGRIVLKHREEEIVVEVAGPLRDVELEAGDLVLWDRALRMAAERLERSQGKDLFLESTPSQSFNDIGGLDEAIESLRRAVRLHVEHADLVQRYRLPRRGSALLVGPPGTGKSMLARALANDLARSSETERSKFIHVKPAGLHSPWYGQTELNYREAFRAARLAARGEPGLPVVMFFDEIDAIGAARGEGLSRVGDQVLTAFMAELDGLEERGNIFIVGATNRADAMDPALLRPGRLGDLVLRIDRPGRMATRAIFSKHLHASIPFAGATDARTAGDVREELIDVAVSRLFRTGDDSELAHITLRDGSRRAVVARDLVSGAVVAKIVMDATERACNREIATGVSGVRAEDLIASVDAETYRAAQMLTPHNCRKHLSDLPQGVDVVRVEPVERRVVRPIDYLRIA